jgi:ABC-type polysaccharide/polyol phosphate transport system ATPase subunit
VTAAAAIVGRDVAKLYRKHQHRNQFRTLKSALLTGSLLSDLTPEETFSALDGVSFEVPRGSTFGVIGENGSGKSTLLKLVAGITKPTRGSLVVDGRVSALIELGAGFHPEISGRENVAINGIMLGLSRKEVDRRFDEIVEFAELRDFIDAPVKTYSSGMYMRLGFAVAIHVDPDVLLIDEVLAVGDEGFTRKCLDKFAEFRRRGKTILFVTHSLGLVEKMCDEALWLRHGKAVDDGDPRRVVGAYLTYVASSEESQLSARTAAAVASAEDASGEPPAALPGASEAAVPAEAAPEAEPAGGGGGYRPGRWGSRAVEIVSVALEDERGRARHVFVPGETLTIALRVRAARPVDDFVFGIGLCSAEGTTIYGTNTDIEGWQPERLAGEAEVRVRLHALRLVEGSYLLDVATHRRDGTPYDFHRGLYSFRVKSRVPDVGLYRPEHSWSFNGDVALTAPEPRPELALADEPADRGPA